MSEQEARKCLDLPGHDGNPFAAKGPKAKLLTQPKDLLILGHGKSEKDPIVG
jgi:hypothetical protein